MNSKVPLVGEELEAHLEAERIQKEREAAHQAAVDRSRRMLEADDLDSDSDSESEGTPEDGIIISRAKDANAYAGDGEDVRQMSFDIFVKGQQTRVGRGGDVGGMARFRMFPFLERRGRKVDEYGEGLDIGQWVRKGREIEEEGETEEVREARKKTLEEDEKQKIPPEPPSKFVSEQVTVELRASVFYVDMEGLHDGQAIKTIIPDLQPRKLVRNSVSGESCADGKRSSPVRPKSLPHTSSPSSDPSHPLPRTSTRPRSRRRSRLVNMSRPIRLCSATVSPAA
jgi:cleavage and polyadenylation specificity factor subunit 2